MKILILDDSTDRQAFFLRWLDEHSLVAVETAAAALTALRVHDRFDAAFLDHDLGAGPTGLVVAEYIAKMLAPPREVVVHSSNDAGAAAMVAVLRDGGVSAVRHGFVELLADGGPRFS